MEGTALPIYREQIAEFEKRWGRKLHKGISPLAYEVCWVAIDPSLLLLATNRLAGQKTKAAPCAVGVIDRRPMLGRVDADGNDARETPAALALCFAAALNLEPDFVLAVMPKIRAAWLKGNAAAQWENPKRPGKARDLRAPGGESKRAILLGVLDDAEADDDYETITAAAEVVAPWLKFTPKDVSNAKAEHRKKKPPHKSPAKCGAKRKG